MYFTLEVASPGVYLSWSLAGGGATGIGHPRYRDGRLHMYSVPSELENLLWARWQYRRVELYYHAWIAYARHEEHMCNIGTYKNIQSYK